LGLTVEANEIIRTTQELRTPNMRSMVILLRIATEESNVIIVERSSILRRTVDLREKRKTNFLSKDVEEDAE